MSLRDLRLAWRLLCKEPAYSAVAVLGLAVALAACFLLAGLVRYAWTYNAAIPGSGAIYTVKERRNLFPRPEWRESGPAPLAQAALAAGLVLDATGGRRATVGVRVDGADRERLRQVDLAVVEANYLRFFGIRAIAGDADAALARPDALVLARAEALRLFGTADALGKVLRIDGRPFTVRAILPDLPDNTSPDFRILLGKGVHTWYKPPATEQAAWSALGRQYLKPAPGVGAARLAAALQDIVATRRDAALPAQLTAGRPTPLTDIGVTPLNRVYFDADLLAGSGDDAGVRYGSPAAIAGLAGLALLILALAASNYVNLAAVRTAARRREIAVRKALGISGPGLARQFLADALLVGAGSTLIGAVLAWLALPLFSELVNRPLASAFTPLAWAVLAGAGTGTGLLAGLYPAWLAARVPASVALGGRAGETLEGLRLRRVLSVAQFAAAIGLVAASLTVWWQASYASGANPGFDPSQQLVLALPGEPGSAAAHAFRAELERLPAAAGVTVISEAIGRDGMQITKNVAVARSSGGQDQVPIEVKEVGANFFDVFGLQPVAGKLFARRGEDGVVLNARAALALGFASPEAALGQIVDRDKRVIGIAPDLRFTTLRDKSGPIMYMADEEQGVVVVRARGALPAARAAMEALWARHFPNDEPDIETAASVFARNYREDMRQARLLALASTVATALACFGIYVLSSYTVRRRAREIVLRKLHGASPRHIGLLVAREWLALLGLGAALALAPAWLFGQRYLAAYVERAPMGAWPQLAACALVAAVALGACLRQAVAAMRMPPVQALRD